MDGWRWGYRLDLDVSSDVGLDVGFGCVRRGGLRCRVTNVFTCRCRRGRSGRINSEKITFNKVGGQAICTDSMDG